MRSIKPNIKAVGLLSGGLDSTLAAKLMIEQGIAVYAVNFTSPFCTCTPKKAGCAAVVTAVRGLGGIPLKRIAMRDEYLDMVKHPAHGYGSQMNPCIDCRIMKIKKAGEYMHKIGAMFIFTGEVLGQRPMSQHKQAMELISKESGFSESLLRPLSAAHFEPTIAEREGWVDRNKLLAITGRSRKTQMSLAAEKGIRDYPCPAGGCLLTDRNFAERLRDYLRFTKDPAMRDVPLLKIGRHFRLKNSDKVIVARNKKECHLLNHLCRERDHLFAPFDFPGPTVILQGSTLKVAINKLLRYTKPPVTGNARVIHRYLGERKIKPLDAIRNGNSA